MHVESLLFGGLLGLSSLATAAPHIYPTPTFTFITPPPPGETYTVGYPLCGIPGYTQVPGNYTEIIEQESNSTLKCCLNQCRAAYPACRSIGFNPKYTECLFFNQVVENTQLSRDNTSSFIHYDLKCHVR